MNLLIKLFFSAFKLITKLTDIEEKNPLNEILLELITTINILNNSETEKNSTVIKIRNIVLNLLLKIPKIENNKFICEIIFQKKSIFYKPNGELIKIFSSEFFFNLLKFIKNCEKKNENIKIIFDNIISNISFQDIIYILMKIKEISYEKANIIFDLIIDNFDILQYIFENYIIRRKINDLLYYFLDLKNTDNPNQILNNFDFHYLLIKIIILSLHSQKNIDFKYDFLLYHKLYSFLLDIKQCILNEQLENNFIIILISTFKALIIELFEEENIVNKIKFVKDKKAEINNLKVKIINSQRYYYLDYLIGLITSFEPIIEIISVLNYYFEAIKDLYISENKKINGGSLRDYKQIVENNENYFIFCNFIHIFQSKGISSKYYQYLINYLKKINSTVFNTYPNIKSTIIGLFYLCESPFYYNNILDLFKCSNSENEKYLTELLETITNLSQIPINQNNNINDIFSFNEIIREENNFYYYLNIIYLLKIFYYFSKVTSICNNEQFKIYFLKLLYLLKKQKLILSQYLIKINKNNQKTILQICFEIILSITNINNENYINSEKIKWEYFNFIMNEQESFNNNSLIFIFDDLYVNFQSNPTINENTYSNKNFDNFSIEQNYQKEERSLLLIMINYILSLKNKEKSIFSNNFENNNNIDIISNININIHDKNLTLDNYLQKLLHFLIKLLVFKGSFKKMKNNDLFYNSEIEYINSFDFGNLTEEYVYVKINDFLITNLLNNTKINISNEIDENYKLEELENKSIKECCLKENCFLIDKKQNSFDLKISYNYFDTMAVGGLNDIEPKDIIIKLKPDLLLKDCSIYFDSIYFNDNNLNKIKSHFFINNKKYIDINTIKENCLNFPSRLKNYHSFKFSTPKIFLATYTNFYTDKNFKIYHKNFDIGSIKKNSFPNLPKSQNELLKIINNNNKKEKIFDCELIRIKNSIFGIIELYPSYLIFKNKKQLGNYASNIKYLFSSGEEIISVNDKIIIINYINIEAIMTRSFLYNFQAFEIFLKNGKSYFFNLFKPENLDLFYETIENLTKNKLNIDLQIIKDYKNHFLKQEYTKKWSTNEITTYQYLLYVNNYSGRSFNDMSQYPIFPWLFFTPEKKDNKYIPTYRNMSYFIQSQEEEGKNKAIELYEMSKEENEKHSYHFRLHYSTASYVILFLFKIFPYTEAQINLQSGQFDSPNRIPTDLFEFINTIKNSKDNRELIPEFFTSVEFLFNLNFLDIGIQTYNKIIHNFKVPIMFNSLAQFIYLSRLILNNHLYKGKYNLLPEIKINKWIDIIYGIDNYPPSFEKLNAFDKYSYRQNINLQNKLEKYIEKKYTEKQIIKKIKAKRSLILNFGQCPDKLFDNKHISYSGDSSDNKTYFDFYSLSNKKKIDFSDCDIKIISFWVSNYYIFFLIKKTDENVKKIMKILVYDYSLNKKYDVYINKIKIFNQSTNFFDKKFSVKKNEIKKSLDFRYSFLVFDTDSSVFDQTINENKNQYLYLLNPKDALFDISFENNIYLIVGRNKDNTLKIYSLEKNNNKYFSSYKVDSFISCLYKKNQNFFFSGHLNGKLLEWKINFFENTIDRKIIKKISNIIFIRDIFAHKDMICSIDYNEKHNVILSTDLNGILYVRKYYDFELLTKIEVNQNNFINKVFLNNYDIICCVIYDMTEEKFKFCLYSINGLFFEESKYFSCSDVSVLKNGKIIFNNLNSSILYIFGLNGDSLGKVNEFDILKDLKINRLEGDSIERFVISEKNIIYILMKSGKFYRKYNLELNKSSFGVDKFN